MLYYLRFVESRHQLIMSSLHNISFEQWILFSIFGVISAGSIALVSFYPEIINGDGIALFPDLIDRRDGEEGAEDEDGGSAAGDDEALIAAIISSSDTEQETEQQNKKSSKSLKNKSRNNYPVIENNVTEKKQKEIILKPKKNKNV